MEDPKWSKVRQKLERKEGLEGFTIGNDGLLYYQDRKVIPIDPEIKDKILREAYHTPYTAPSGSTRMYQDLK